MSFRITLISWLFFVMSAVQTSQADTPQTLSPDEARAALIALEQILTSHHAHASASSYDVSNSIRRASLQIQRELTLNELILVMESILSPIGDGHAEVRLESRRARDAMRGIVGGGRIDCLPFLPKMISERPGSPVIAILPDRSGFVDPSHPILETIDGIPIERWIDAIAMYIPAGSTAYMRSRALRELRELWRWREVLGVPADRQVRLSLANLERTSRIEIRRPSRSGRPSRGTWPRTESRVLDDRFGYLRLATMNLTDDDLAELEAWMSRFRDTDGLIIDVRGNGGGQRRALHVLRRYLMPPDADPLVYIAARPLLVDGGGVLSLRMQRRLADRFLFPADHPGWTEAEREAIASLHARSLHREAGDDNRFGPWHYAVLRPPGDGNVYHYGGPVVVLMDANCFSATDVFLHAVRQFENVTLIGQPSAGSSGAPLSWPMPIPDVSVRVSSIVSYRVDGSHFDNGQSEQPDVRVDPSPRYFIGRTDEILDAAVRHLTDAANRRTLR